CCCPISSDLIPKLRLGTHGREAPLRVRPTGKALPPRGRGSGASRRAFPSGAWERGGESGQWPREEPDAAVRSLTAGVAGGADHHGGPRGHARPGGAEG